MGKLSLKPGVEIIPLNEVHNKNRMITHSSGYNPSRHHIRMEQRFPYFSDPSIVPRVQKYLEANVDKTYVDINVMADHLQNTYREYAKRKRSAFRAAVKKAYGVVLQSYGLEDHGGSSTDDEVSDDGGQSSLGNNFPHNSLNNQLVNMYMRPPISKPVNESELIDISSDDSEANTTNNNDKAVIASSTSQRKEPLLDINSVIEIAKKNSEKKGEKLQEKGKKRKFETLNVPTFQGNAKKKKSLATLQEPSVTFKDVGGIDKILEDICKLLIHVKHPEVYRQIGISPPRGFLLHGPPGCGKTLVANAIAGEIGVPLLKVAAPELVAGVSGESEERIRELFERAVCSTPCILFIDEIDAITPNRQNAQKEMERRIVAQLLSCLDDLNQNENGDRVLVIGATNRPDAIDPALRRAGRFDREICLGIPNVEARVQILKVLTSKLKLAPDFDYERLAKFTPGFVGADLMSLTREAAMVCVNKAFMELKDRVSIPIIEKPKTPDDSLKATTSVEGAVAPAPNEANKSDPEIIVDDDPKVCEVSETIVIDDDGTKQSVGGVAAVIATPTDNAGGVAAAVATPIGNGGGGEPAAVVAPIETQALAVDVDVAVTNGNENEQSPPKEEPMPIVEIKTPLQDLITWLHDHAPMTEQHLQSLCITMEDFGKALKCVQPSAKREGFATVPDVTWEDVGSLQGVRDELQMSILAPIRYPEKFKELGLTTPTGLLLCGPPGCGKTLLAKAIANEAGINFISVKGPELLNMYVGESERAVRVCFERARNSAPCVIFFDELDAICPKRSDTREGGATMRVVNQMLTEMDGVEGRDGVFLLAASNRPDIIDPAVLRPGRLDKIVFVGLPTAADRVDILKAITKNGTTPRLSPDVDLEMIGSSEECRGYTGADLAALVREAGIVALKEFMVFGDQRPALVVTTEHFKRAVAKIRPSVPEKDQKHYEKLRKMYGPISEQTEVEEMEYS